MLKAKAIKIERKLFGDTFIHFECANCGQNVLSGQSFYKYCPGCGAKLEDPTDERLRDLIEE